MRTFAKTCLTVLMTFTALGASAVASADERVREERLVSFADLNLDQSEGVQKLYGRLRAAARHVCGGMNGPQPHLLSISRSCARKSLGEAVTQLGHPAIVDLHLARTRATEKIRTAAAD